jgi:hypothetical protein
MISSGILTLRVDTGQTDELGSPIYQSVSQAISATAWHFVVGWIDNQKVLSLQVDNAAPITLQLADWLFGDTDTFFLGNAGGSGPFGFRGQLDEFSLWQRALTANERTRLYNNGAGLAFPWD